ncbi:RHS repeat-associated core domain-containing protein, partial [Parazoarcus communis]|uniref:RHS repeat-associated core domain-containing protein n=2 Tax=Parazoarcus communis TaxID=41977 RepID=UPI001459B25E
PYGEPNVTTGARFRYTGQQYLGELNLYYYKARFYSPALGRFLQTDPIGTADDLNLYAYVGNNPVNRFDPLGLSAVQSDQLNGGVGGLQLGSSFTGERIEVAGGPLLPLLGLGLMATEVATSDVPILGGSTAKAAARVGEIATASNYRLLFKQARPDLPSGWQVHHSMPQKYQDVMAV